MGDDIKTSRQNITHYIKIIIGLVICFAFWLSPPFSHMTVGGMKVIGIFLAVLVLVTVDEIEWASIFGIAMMAFTIPEIFPDYTGVGIYRIMEMSFGFWLIPFIIANLLLCYALQETGVIKRVSYWFLRRPIAQRSPWHFTFFFLVAALFVGCWMDTTTSFIFFVGIAHSIFKELGYKKGDTFPAMLLGALCVTLMLTFAMTPISHGSMMTALGLIQGLAQAPLNILTFMIIGIPVGVVLFIGVFFLFKKFYKVDVSIFEKADLKKIIGEKTPVTKREKWSATIFIIVVFLWLFSGALNISVPTAALTVFFNRITLVTPAAFGVILMLIIRVEGRPLLSFEKAARGGGVVWNIMLFLSCMMMMSTMVSDPGTGFTATISSALQPLINSGISPFMLMFFIAIVAAVLTNFMNNIPIMILFLNVCIPLAPQLGVSGVAIGMTVTIASQMAFATPAAFATSTILFADEWAIRKNIYKLGFINMAWTAIAVGLIAFAWASIFV